MMHRAWSRVNTLALFLVIGCTVFFASPAHGQTAATISHVGENFSSDVTKQLADTSSTQIVFRGCTFGGDLKITVPITRRDPHPAITIEDCTFTGTTPTVAVSFAGASQPRSQPLSLDAVAITRCQFPVGAKIEIAGAAGSDVIVSTGVTIADVGVSIPLKQATVSGFRLGTGARALLQNVHVAESKPTTMNGIGILGISFASGSTAGVIRLEDSSVRLTSSLDPYLRGVYVDGFKVPSWSNALVISNVTAVVQTSRRIYRSWTYGTSHALVVSASTDTSSSLAAINVTASNRFSASAWFPDMEFCAIINVGVSRDVFVSLAAPGAAACVAGSASALFATDAPLELTAPSWAASNTLQSTSTGLQLDLSDSPESVDVTLEGFSFDGNLDFAAVGRIKTLTIRHTVATGYVAIRHAVVEQSLRIENVSGMALELDDVNVTESVQTADAISILSSKFAGTASLPGMKFTRCHLHGPLPAVATSSGASGQAKPYEHFFAAPSVQRRLRIDGTRIDGSPTASGATSRVDGVHFDGCSVAHGAFVAVSTTVITTRARTLGYSSGFRLTDARVDASSSFLVFGADNVIAPGAGVYHYRGAVYGHARGIVVDGASSNFSAVASIVFTTPANGNLTLVQPTAREPRNADSVVFEGKTSLSQAMAQELLRVSVAAKWPTTHDFNIDRFSSPYVVDGAVIPRGGITFRMPHTSDDMLPMVCATGSGGVHLVVRDSLIEYGISVVGAGCIDNITIINSTVGGLSLANFVVARAGAVSIVDSILTGPLQLLTGVVTRVNDDPDVTPAPCILMTRSAFDVRTGPVQRMVVVQNVLVANRTTIRIAHSDCKMRVAGPSVGVQIVDTRIQHFSTLELHNLSLTITPHSNRRDPHRGIVLEGSQTLIELGSALSISDSRLFVQTNRDSWVLNRATIVHVPASAGQGWWSNQTQPMSSRDLHCGLILRNNSYAAHALHWTFAVALNVEAPIPWKALEESVLHDLLKSTDSDQPATLGSLWLATDWLPSWPGLRNIKLNGEIVLATRPMAETSAPSSELDRQTIVFDRVSVSYGIRLEGLGRRRAIGVFRTPRLGGLTLRGCTFVDEDAAVVVADSTLRGALTLAEVSLDSARIIIENVFFDESRNGFIALTQGTVLRNSTVLLRRSRGTAFHRDRTALSGVFVSGATITDRSVVRIDTVDLTTKIVEDKRASFLRLSDSSVVANQSVIAVVRSQLHVASGRHLYAGYTFGTVSVISMTNVVFAGGSELYIGNGTAFTSWSYVVSSERFLDMADHTTVVDGNARMMFDGVHVARMSFASIAPTVSLDGHLNFTVSHANISSDADVHQPPALKWLLYFLSGPSFAHAPTSGPLAISFSCVWFDGSVVNATTLDGEHHANTSVTVDDECRDECKTDTSCNPSVATGVFAAGELTAATTGIEGLRNTPLCDCSCHQPGALFDVFRCWPSVSLESVYRAALDRHPRTSSVTASMVAEGPTATASLHATPTLLPDSSSGEPSDAPVATDTPTTPPTQPPATVVTNASSPPRNTVTATQRGRRDMISTTITVHDDADEVRLPPTSSVSMSTGVDPRRPAAREDRRDKIMSPLVREVVASVIGPSAVAAALITPVAASRALRMGSTLRTMECVLGGEDVDGDDVGIAGSSQVNPQEAAAAVDDGAEDEAPSRVELPFQFSLGTTGRFRILAGAALASTLIILALTAMHSALTVVLWRMSSEQRSKSALKSAVRYGTAVGTAVGLSFWGPPLTSAAVVLSTVDDTTPEQRFAGVLTGGTIAALFIAAVVFVLVYFNRYARVVPYTDNTKHCDQNEGSSSTPAEGSREAPCVAENNMSVDNPTPFPYMEACGLLLDATHAPQLPTRRAYFIVEVSLALLAAAMEGTRPESRSTCLAAISVMFACGILGLVYILYTAPYWSRVESAFAVIFAVGNLVVAFGALLTLWADAAAKAVGYVVVIMAFLFFLQAVVLAVISGRRWWNRWQQQSDEDDGLDTAHPHRTHQRPPDGAAQPLLTVPTPAGQHPVPLDGAVAVRVGSAKGSSGASSDRRDNPLEARR